MLRVRAYFHKQNEARRPPIFRSEGFPTSVPHRRDSQVETPRSPIGAFPVFSARSRLPAVSGSKSKTARSNAPKPVQSKAKSSKAKSSKAKSSKAKPSKAKSPEPIQSKARPRKPEPNAAA